MRLYLTLGSLFIFRFCFFFFSYLLDGEKPFPEIVTLSPRANFTPTLFVLHIVFKEIDANIFSEKKKKSTLQNAISQLNKTDKEILCSNKHTSFGKDQEVMCHRSQMKHENITEH